MTPLVRVVSAAEAAQRDAMAIAGGTPSRTLMQRAGAAAATAITRRYRDRLAGGVAIYAGPGNNGGDAWVVARALNSAGVPVRVACALEPRTDDARAERALACASGVGSTESGDAIVLDGLLGTGSAGPPRGEIAEAIGEIAERRAAGAVVVALDVPSGLDATTGSTEGSVVADRTLVFGAVKRGQLISRARCGAITVLDIGLPDDGANHLPGLIDRRFVARNVPPIPADAHKGARKRLAVIGGGAGMAGAAVLVAQAALRSGVGLVRLVVAPANVGVVQAAAFEAIAAPWPADDDAVRATITEWADAIVVGPGLGRTVEARTLVERVVNAARGPLLIDADALNVFERDVDALGRLLGGRPTLITPHPAELARLVGCEAEAVLDRRFEIGGELAARLRATVLLKGVPTVISDADGRRLVSAAGTNALATGGSGDVLSGVAGTLLAQLSDPLPAAACAAWVHGRAAEIAGRRRSTRGVALADIVRALRHAWPQGIGSASAYPVIAELPLLDRA